MRIFYGIIALLCILLGVLALSQAAEVSLDVTQTYYQNDEKFCVLDSYGLKLKVKHEMLYGFASYDTGGIRLTGIGALNHFNIYGVGLGLEVPVVKHVSVFGDFGYYTPKMEKESIDGHAIDYGQWEGYYAYINGVHSIWGGPHSWDFYEHSLKANFGGTVGVKVAYPITNSINLGLVYSYQMLKLEETIAGKMVGWQDGGWWEYKTERDFSNHKIGFNFTYTF